MRFGDVGRLSVGRFGLISFMDWHLIYRNHADMQALADSLPAGAVADCRIFDDSDDAITFLLVSKAG